MKSWATLMKMFFGASYRLLLQLNLFLFFWDSCPCSGPIWKKKTWKFEKKIPKMFNFWNFICGSAAEILADRPKIPSKIFFCPKLLPKQFCVKSDHYIIKISKKSTPPPQKWPFFGGGRGRTLYVTYPNNVLNWSPCHNSPCPLKFTDFTTH